MKKEKATGNLQWEGDQLMQEWRVKEEVPATDARGIRFTRYSEYKEWRAVPRVNAAAQRDFGEAYGPGDKKMKCPWCSERISTLNSDFGRCPHCDSCIVRVGGHLERDGVFHASNAEAAESEGCAPDPLSKLITRTWIKDPETEFAIEVEYWSNGKRVVVNEFVPGKGFAVPNNSCPDSSEGRTGDRCPACRGIGGVGPHVCGMCEGSGVKGKRPGTADKEVSDE
ncbi:MAG: hypothetical protein JJU29_10530 [Verrucomicrobia bacterium]|nr:hypothetical protein [Verrucomicrobiota bacterium]